MSTNSYQIDQDSLFWKFFSNEASPDEKRLLLNWVKQSDENSEQFKAARVAFISTKNPASISRFNGTKAYESYKKSTTKKTISMWKTVSIAAMVTLLVGTGITYWLLTSKSSRNEIVSFTCENHETKAVTLPDGSSVMFHNKTSISYNIASTENRSVQLQGEAFFDVIHDKDKPFVININGLTIKVLGTSFIVNTETSNNTVSVKVISGRVMMITDNSSIILSANQIGYYHKEKEELSMHKEYDKNDIAWKTNELNFNATPLSIVAEKLGKYFDKNISIPDQNVAEYQLSVELEKPNLDSVLQLLQLTFNIEIIKTDSTIVLRDNKINN